PKLKNDGSNWGNYKEMVFNAITVKGLRRHALGTARAPAELTARDREFFLPNRLAPLSDTELEDHETKLDDPSNHETVSEATFIGIKSYPSAVLMLQQLVSTFENKGEMVPVTTLTRVQTVRCLHDDDVVKHITEMQRLREALDSMGTPLDDAQFAAYIKASLPDKFRSLL
ncbi:hypothetical protein B0H14DRAFT_2251866, partial [Mycena olivaceomarginata]